MNDEDKKLREKLEAKFDELFSDLDDELPNPDDEIETIILNNEKGEEIEFEFMDLIAYEGEEYVVLLPVVDCENAGEVIILRLENNYIEDKDVYLGVDDNRILSNVFEIFKNKFADEFNFSD